MVGLASLLLLAPLTSHAPRDVALRDVALRDVALRDVAEMNAMIGEKATAAAKEGMITVLIEEGEKESKLYRLAEPNRTVLQIDDDGQPTARAMIEIVGSRVRSIDRATSAAWESPSGAAEYLEGLRKRIAKRIEDEAGSAIFSCTAAGLTLRLPTTATIERDEFVTSPEGDESVQAVLVAWTDAKGVDHKAGLSYSPETFWPLRLASLAGGNAVEMTVWHDRVPEDQIAIADTTWDLWRERLSTPPEDRIWEIGGH